MQDSEKSRGFDIGTMSSSKMITLISSDSQAFEVDEAVAAKSQTIKYVIEDASCIDGGIPVPNVTGKILAKVLEYCKKHVEPTISGNDFKDWDAEFINVDQATLFGLIMAADYLEINSLLDLTCQKMANMMKGKTPEEEEEFRLEYRWAFD